MILQLLHTKDNNTIIRHVCGNNLEASVVLY